MRNQLLAAVKAQLECIEATGDLALALEPRALNDAYRLAEVLGDGDIEVPYVLGWFHWYRYLALPEGQDRGALEEATRVLTLCFITEVEGLPEQLLPRLADNSIDVAVHLLEQATSTNDPTLITATVSLWQRVVTATPVDHPARAARLSGLGAALRMRFERVGARADLDEAITISRAAVQASPTDHSDRAAMLSNLGIALQVRFRGVGASADLDEAVTVGRAAVQAIPIDHPDRAGSLSHLGLALRVRFGQVGAQVDLDEAIAVGREAVQATAINHPDRALYLSNLGLFLRVRFERVGERADLDEAITVSREAVQATPPDHPNRAGGLSNLGAALQVRFKRVGAQADLDEAVTVSRMAVQAVPPNHPDRAGWLSNLGAALQVRFKRVGAQADLDEAVTVGRVAVQATPPDHPGRARRLSNLGAALRVRFGRVGSQADLDEAVTVGREAVQAIPVDHPDRAAMLFNLGAALQVRFERVGARTDLDEAVNTYVRATEVVSGAPSVRIRAARSAASLAAQADTRRVAGLLETAVRLLPETASRRLDRGDQQYALGGFVGLASDAAALALADEADARGEPAVQALRLLELGRGVMLSQVLDTRSDLTDLQVHHPALAARFIEFRDQFDQAGGIPVPISDADAADGQEQRRLADRQQLAIAFEATVTKIRSLEGFRTFLLPPEPDQLVCHAQQGPVVVVNVSQYRSDAVLLRPEGITSIPLPDLVQDALIDRIASFMWPWTPRMIHVPARTNGEAPRTLSVRSWSGCGTPRPGRSLMNSATGTPQCPGRRGRDCGGYRVDSWVSCPCTPPVTTARRRDPMAGSQSWTG